MDKKSEVVGVHAHYTGREGEHGRVQYWRSQVKRDGVVTTLYYGLDKEEAERARDAYDRSNPDFDPYDYDYRRRHTILFDPVMWADWPASLPSWEQKEDYVPMPVLGRTTIVRRYDGWRDKWNTTVNGVPV